MKALSLFLVLTLSLGAFCPMSLGMDDMNHGGAMEHEGWAEEDCLTGECLVGMNDEEPLLALSGYTVVPALPAQDFESTVPWAVGELFSSVAPPLVKISPTKTIVLRL
ncbi:MAG: hypothetical protein WC777_03950 [Candidatus Gracilibacteria bacterium]|jgi:hypothetical protein